MFRDNPMESSVNPTAVAKSLNCFTVMLTTLPSNVFVV